jgi:hypothetical protein
MMQILDTNYNYANFKYKIYPVFNKKLKIIEIYVS